MVIVAEVQLMPESRRLSSNGGDLRRKKNVLSQQYPVTSSKVDLTDEHASLNVDKDLSGIVPRRQFNWELNEQVSLSSGSSVGIEMRPNKNKGIEFEKRSRKLERPSLELMNIEFVGQAPKKGGLQTTNANERNWTQARHKLDKTNEAISKRLELIHELNQKILANYDKFQQKTWRNQMSKASWRKSAPKAADEKNPNLSKSIRKKLKADPNFSLAVKPSFATTTRISVNYHAENEPRSDSCDLYRQNSKTELMYSQPDKLKARSISKSSSTLEKKILRDLNETIDGYDSETKLDDSFNTDFTPKDTSSTTWDDSAVVANGCGWVRLHTGLDSSLIYLTLDTTANDLCRDLLLTDELSIFLQYGGEPGRRLMSHERPLEIQDNFLQQLGYHEPSRRARLGIDPELRHLIAFHVGPSAPVKDLTGFNRCGLTLVLKGLVFPQWKKRILAVIGSRLFLYPAHPDSQPEWMELGGGGGAVSYAPSRLGKLVLRITGFPRITQRSQLNDTELPQRDDAHYQETRHLYLGFHHPWDRDLWFCWLKQATELSACPRKLDLSKGGLSRIPDSTIAFPAIVELVLSQNQLANTDSNLIILHRFPRLRIVNIESNDLLNVPKELLELDLTRLDLSDNKIKEIPSGIKSLVNLKELILDRNGLTDLPKEVEELPHLKFLSLAGNLFTEIPFSSTMRALAVTDVLSKVENGNVYKDEKNNRNSLHKVNLRNNQLKGNIILGNYGSLVHLDVSENCIEKLDVSALQELRSVRCARNILTELTLCGKNLISLIAGNNRLKKLIIDPVPIHLEHLDVSYNELDALPEWTTDLPVLQALFASHNILTSLPDRLLSQSSRLKVLHLPHNKLQALPPPRKPLNIVHLTLQGNALTALPTDFFANTKKMKVLNLSNNRLSDLPYNEENHRNQQNDIMLEKLYLTGNCLTDRALDTVSKFTLLRVLHIAYNVLDTLPESCIASWSEMEELILSGNRLQYLPDNMANLSHLRVLRVHSNRLLTCPSFNKTTSLKVLDLAHNQLDRINLAALVPPQLQFLDISCNSHLHVDPRQFQVYRSKRPVSLVDVSGQNRPSLPSHPHQQTNEIVDRNSDQPWRLGFSETAGNRERLFISQIRMPSFCNVEGLFGVFDGGSNQEAPSALQEVLPRLLLEEKTIRETSKEYLKYTLLAVHRELKEKGQKYGVDATLVHLTRLTGPPFPPTSSSFSSKTNHTQTQIFDHSKRLYSLKVASSGEAKAVLCRASGPLVLASPKKDKLHVKKQLGNSAMFPLVVPDPVCEEVILDEDDEFIIIGNKQLWEVLGVQEAVREARAEANPVLAAKRLQDLAQAYGAEDNLSIIVVRLKGPPDGKDFDRVMKEFGQVVRKTRNKNDTGSCSCPCCLPPSSCKSLPAPCCCHVNEGYYLSGVLKNIVNRSMKTQSENDRFLKSPRPASERTDDENVTCSPNSGDDRSSPSGQSDQTTSDGTFKSRRASGRVWSINAASRATNKARQSVRSQDNSHKLSSCLTPMQENVGDPTMSDEQFRCWEYMLEQNTQLLFDKELDTLTTLNNSCGKNGLLRRGQSKSTPHLATAPIISTTNQMLVPPPFVGSKRFGSARSFDPGLRVRSTRPPQFTRFGGSGRRILNTGPNAAYFGSLQRLMPYNLEYDFAVIQERSAALDSLEQDASRMQQYWGIATTEL